VIFGQAATPPVHSKRVVPGALLACAVAVVVSVGLLPQTADAATGSKHPRSLAVSVPSDPVQIAAGQSGTIPIRIVNPGSSPVPVVVSGRAVHLENNGRVKMGNGPDPLWKSYAQFPTGPLTIPADGYTDVNIKLSVPRFLSPDLYFIGFLVSPLPSGGGNLQVVNQIGWFATVDVPGPRLRKLEATVAGPGFVIGGGTHALVDTQNVGRAALSYWGENDVTSWPGGSVPKQTRFDPSLLPVGTSRSFTVTGSPAWLVGVVSMHVSLIYSRRSDSSTTEIQLTKRTLVVSPIAILLAIAAILIGGSWWWRRRRRKKLLRERRGGRPKKTGGATTKPGVATKKTGAAVKKSSVATTKTGAATAKAAAAPAKSRSATATKAAADKTRPAEASKTRAAAANKTRAAANGSD